MTILKLTSSKKGVLIYDDDGRAYITSVAFVQGLLMGKAPSGFITTKRLPFNIAPDRFKKSELHDPDGVFEGNAEKTLTTNTDALSNKVKEEKKEKKSFEDKQVW